MLRYVLPLIFALIMLTASAVVLRPPGEEQSLLVTDYPGYYAAAKLMSRGHADQVYRVEILQAEEERFWATCHGRFAFVAEPPFFMPIFEPLANLTPDVGRACFIGCGVIATAFAVIILASTLELTTPATYMLIVLTAASGPYWETMNKIKPAPLLLLGVCGALWLFKRFRPGCAGISTLMCLVKPHEIIPFLAFALGARRGAYILALAAGAIVLGVVSLWTFGIPGWANYFLLLSEMSRTPDMIEYYWMPSLRGQLSHLQLDWAVVNKLSAAVYVASLLFLFWFGRKFTEEKRWWMVGMSCASLVSITFGLHCHQYDVLLLVPAVAILIKEAAAARHYPMLITAGLLSASYFWPVFVAIHYFYLHSFSIAGATTPLINLHFVLLLATTICAFVFFKQSAFRPPRPDGSSAGGRQHRGGLAQSGI